MRTDSNSLREANFYRVTPIGRARLPRMKLVKGDLTTVDHQNTSDDPTETATALPAHLPKLIDHGGMVVPAAPGTLEETGIDPSILSDLTLKLANSVSRLTTEWAAEELRLPHSVMDRLLSQLRDDQYLEVLGQNGPLTYRYAITDRGRAHARWLLEISGYVGPAPVALDAYAAMLQWQIARQLPVRSEDVVRALSPLTLPP